MKAKGFCGQGNGLSQKLALRKDLAAELQADQKQCKSVKSVSKKPSCFFVLFVLFVVKRVHSGRP